MWRDADVADAYSKGSIKPHFSGGVYNLLYIFLTEKSRLHGKWIRKQPGVEKDLLRNKYARMRNMRNQIKDEIRKSKARYENDIAEKSQTSSKVFWSFIRKN